VARFGRVEWSKARFSTVGLGVTWYGDVLRSGVLLGLSWLGKLLCGVVWSVEALHGIVKFSDVRRGAVLPSAVRQAKALLRPGIVSHGTVESCLVRLGAAGQALLSFSFSDVRWGAAIHCVAGLGNVRR